jgi:hypothetical protein
MAGSIEETTSFSALYISTDTPRYPDRTASSIRLRSRCISTCSGWREEELILMGEQTGAPEDVRQAARQ